MIDNVSTHGRAYTSDPAYAEFLGPQKTRIYYDWGLRAYVKATIQEPKTPHDRVQPADVDDALQSEPLPAETNRRNAQLALARLKTQREMELVPQLVALLREHGPMSGLSLKKRLRISNERILRTLRNHRDVFVYLGGFACEWGLRGETYERRKRPSRDTESMLAIRDALRDHGPQTVRELAERFETHPSSISKTMALRKAWFVVVGVRKGEGNTPNSKLWGLAE